MALTLGLVMSTPAAGKEEAARVIHVAVDGNDTWSGRSARANAGGTGGPVASLARAVALAKAPSAKAPSAKAPSAVDGERQRSVRVILGPGTYFMGEPLVLKPDDSGLPDLPITFTAAPGR